MVIPLSPRARDEAALAARLAALERSPLRLEAEDIQRIVVSAHRRLPCAAYRLLAVTDAAPARRWLALQAERVSTAARGDRFSSLEIAFTHGGLAALGVPDDALRTFPHPFRDGMHSVRRARILGDHGADAARGWRWGGPDTARVHALLLVYAIDEVELARQLARCTPPDESGVAVVETLVAGRQPDDNREHFGFVDGIGQPVLEGSGLAWRQRRRTGHATVIPAGEVLLGYDDADGRPAAGPSVAPDDDPRGLLLGVPDDERARVVGRDGRHDLGRNGSYLVFRQLAQDVVGFWAAAARLAETLWPGDPGGADRLAAKMVGRWPSGAPLALHPRRDPASAPGAAPDEAAYAMNDFAYAAADPHGHRCPLGSHLRRANPRDGQGANPADSLRSAMRHRLLRRGRSYGPRIADRAVEDGAARGLHFICLNADIERQFEFVQQTWLNNPAFGGLPGEADPLVGAHPPGGGEFTLQGDPLRQRVCGVRTHVAVRGGAYFFLPGMRALRYIVGAGRP